MITTVEPAQYVPTPYLWSSEEYQRLAETGVFSERRIELIEGRLLNMSPMGTRHTTAVALSAREFQRVLTENLLVRLQSPLEIENRSQPEPDVAIVRGDIRDYASKHPTAAELVVEVADTSLQFDRTTKATLYASAGMNEYWIINLIENQIEIHRSPTPGDGYAEISILKAGEKISSLVLPDAQIAVSDLLP